MGQLINSSPDEVREIISNQKDEILIIDIWASWCGPCKALEPILAKLSEEEDVTVAKIQLDNKDIEEEAKLYAGELGVRGIPALFLYKNGENVDKINGMISLEELKERVNKIK